jgi:hypothetical protein
MGYTISKAHRCGKCRYCTRPVARNATQIIYGTYQRGRDGSLNFFNFSRWHVACLPHNIALKMFDANKKLKDVRFYIPRDEARDVTQAITDMAYGFDATELSNSSN